MAEANVEKTQEQDEESMEEILHSIRDIIASETEAGAETKMAEATKEPEEEILELTEVVEGGAAPAGGDVLDEIDSALKAQPDSAPEPKQAAAAPAPAKKKPKPAAALMSEDAAEATAESIKRAMQKASRDNPKSLQLRSGTTVEDLVVEALKPMLAEWLNENLPRLVRHIVQKEIRHILPQDE